MVSVDYKTLILGHIRKCFLTGDDYGFCELLLNRQFGPELVELNDVSTDHIAPSLIDTEAADFSRFSPELPYVEFPDFSPLRDSKEQKCNTDPGRSQLKQSCQLKDLSTSDIDYYFPIKPATLQSNAVVSPKKSCLTVALEQAQADGRLARSNLFADFCVHDGRPVATDSSDLANRQFTVWFWRIDNFPRTSIRVLPRVGTTVRQFVGLTFWQYFNQLTRSDAPSELFANLTRFNSAFLDRISVYMLDTPDEELDADFPPLEPTDPIHKYDFESLAFVEQADTRMDEAASNEIPPLLVTIHMTQGISTFRFPADTQLSAVLERAARRRKLPQHGGYEYHLESWPQSVDQRHHQSAVVSKRSNELRKGQQLDLNLRLSDVVAARLPLRFVLVRDNSRCDPAMVDSPDEDEPEEETATVIPSTVRNMETSRPNVTLHLRQYRVTLLRGLFPREVQLNVSADGIKVEQVAQSRRPKFFSKPLKPMLFTVDAVADCELVSSACSSSSSARSNASEIRPGSPISQKTAAFTTGKVQFRIIHMTQGSGHSISSVHPSISLSQCTGPVDGDSAPPMDNSGVQFQQLCFETQWARARAICDQVALILECCESKARQVYMQRRLAAA